MSTRAQIQALINALGTGQPNTALEVRTVLNAIAYSVHLTGDTKEIVCDATYVTNNFDGTGLGTNERLGWAIMNGNNGTANDDGLTVIGYGAVYDTLEDEIGSADAVVVEHTHGQRASSSVSDDAKQVRNTLIGGETGLINNTNGSLATSRTQVFTDSSGVTGVGANIQPSRVRLRIIKL